VTSDVVALALAVGNSPGEDAPRLMLQDELRALGLWTRAGIASLVCESPPSDGLRRVAADWFQEEGHIDRAELIRIQIATASTPPPLRDAAAYRRYLDRLSFGQRLLAANADAFCRYVWPWRKESWQSVRVGFNRGFPEELTLPLPHWLARADELFRRPDRKCPATAVPVRKVVFIPSHFRWGAAPIAETCAEPVWRRRKLIGFRLPGRATVHAPALSDGIELVPTLRQMFALEWPGVHFFGIAEGEWESVGAYLHRTKATPP
jgi:uncharacterized protein (TIGR02996 family)